MLFRRLIWCALGAALLVGSLQSAVQRWQTDPILRAAEAFEDRKVEPAAATQPAHDHAGAVNEHNHYDEAWTPADGAERSFWSWAANVLHAFSMALLMFAVMGIWLWRGGAAIATSRLALAVAAAGWLSLHLWPSLGLPAEVPGLEAAALGARQAWWVLAAASATLACFVLGFGTARWRWGAAVLLLAVPFVVGAPQLAGDPLAGFDGEARTRMQFLEQQFVWTTTWVSLSFWMSLCAVAGVAFERWLRPALLVALGTPTDFTTPATETA